MAPKTAKTFTLVDAAGNGENKVKAFSIPFRRDHILLLGIASLFYFGFTILFGYFQNLRTLVFLTPDAKQYLAVANWLSGGPSTEYIVLRPFLYPLLLNFFRAFSGPYGIWFFQFVMWLLSGILLYQAISEVTHNVPLSLLGYLIFVSNLTLLVLTFHALAEVTVVFLLSVLVYLTAIKHKYGDVFYWYWVIFIAALLTVIKPVYEILWSGMLLIGMPFFILTFFRNKTWATKRKIVGYTFLVLLPIVVQLSIMKTRYNRLSLSYIGQRTFVAYYLAKVYGEEHHLSVIEARKFVNTFTQSEALHYLLQHPKTSTEVYYKTLISNLHAKSNFLNFPQKHPSLSKYMLYVNKVYFYFHVGILLPLISVLIYSLKKKRGGVLGKMLLLLFAQYIIFLTSGITFWQGDRIVLPSLPLWIMLYLMTLQEFRSMIISLTHATGIGKEKDNVRV